MTREKIKGHVAMLIAAIIFGLNIPITKSLMSEGWLSSIGVTYLRMIVAAVSFWTASLFFPREKVARKDMFVLFLGGLFGVMINQASFIVGLEYTSPIDAGLVITITPVLVMILAAIYLKEPITIKKAGGVALGASGAILIILSVNQEHVPGVSENPFLGNMLCFLSSLSYAIYLIVTKPIMQKYSPVTLMKWMFLFAAILSLPLGYSAVITAPAFTAATNYTVILRVLFFTFFATFITYLLIPVALKRIRPTTVSMYNYVQPLVAAVVAISIGQDLLTWQKPVAALLIFGGVYLVTQSKSRADVEKSREQVSKD